MILASIDIGSNAVRLLIADVKNKQGTVQLTKQNLIRIPIRLGQDVYSNGYVSKARTNRFIDTMKAFRLLMDVYSIKAYDACATAAIREASNGQEILKRTHQEAGIEIREIDGIEEAEIIRKTSRVPEERDFDLTLFVDVGGGSTELSMTSRSKLLKQQSFPIGTLKILNNKVTPEHWQELSDWLHQFEAHFGRIHVIGSGGNINKLTKLFGRPNEHITIRNNLKYGYEQMKTMSVEERMEVFNLRADRADVIVPAAKIFLTIMDKIQSDLVLAPRIGVADGLIYQLYEKLNTKNHAS
jgi:exopolyphosphatase/guanosine-5'-triphosphate,3'-diphosphate pyrophosphatase